MIKRPLGKSPILRSERLRLRDPLSSHELRSSFDRFSPVGLRLGAKGGRGAGRNTRAQPLLLVVIRAGQCL